MILGVDWGYILYVVFKLLVIVIVKLMEIVVKGGSLLFGVGFIFEGIL